MTVSHETTRKRFHETGTPPWTDQDGHASRIDTLERETVRAGAGSSPDSDPVLVRETVSRAAVGRGFGSAVRILFGLIWLVDAYFKWQPSFLNRMLDVMHDGTMGQPAWLMPWFRINRAVMATQPMLWAYAIAIVETGIALALVFGFARKLTYMTGAVWSMLIWMTAEGFGRSRPGEVATDIGTAIIYAVVFLAFLALDQCDGTRRYSLDAVIARRLHWWRRVADMRR